MKKQSLILALASLAIFGASLVANAASNTKPNTAKPTTSSVKIAPMNINTATLKQLETLPGIGPKIAANIIKNRPYKNAADLERKVKSIGPKTWKAIQPYVLFN